MPEIIKKEPFSRLFLVLSAEVSVEVIVFINAAFLSASVKSFEVFELSSFT